MTDGTNIFFSFACFSVLGWVLEVVYRSLRDRHFVNPGLLKGPYLPLYGTGALLLMVAISMLHDSNVLIKVFAYALVTTGIELGSGFVAEVLFQTRLWDYSDQRFNYKGHICLKFSIYWILLAFFFEYIIFPPYSDLLIWLPSALKWIFSGATIVAMLMDLLLVLKRNFFQFSPEEENLLKGEFIKIASPLLTLPEVDMISNYKHHRDKTRLDHVKEVAFLSFLLAKRFSLDIEATVRGALLHDLFYYDWLHEGPRLHGFRHHNIAFENARKLVPLTDKEADIIRKHMWPLTIVPPRYMESLVVSLVDTFCSARDYLKLW